MINAVRNGPNWKDSIIFFTYDEHGGSYDHVRPPRARQGGQRTPDGIVPGLCADLSNPPASQQPGGGANCTLSLNIEKSFCAAFAANPTGPFPDECASFDQLGFRVPFMAISPFSKPHYVSHTVADHTSLLAFIEKRFLSWATKAMMMKAPAPDPARSARKRFGRHVRLPAFAVTEHSGGRGAAAGEVTALRTRSQNQIAKA